MRLSNFIVKSSIELMSGELNWDLHNGVKFKGLELVPPENAAVMRWRALNIKNPSGSFENRHSGLDIWFRDLSFLKIGPRDDELPLTEDTCVADILLVDPDVKNDDPYLRIANTADGNSSFHLLFAFQSRRSIEIGARIAELQPIL
jgi:hypothetical protein